MQAGISGNAVLVAKSCFFQEFVTWLKKLQFFPPSFLKDQLGVLTTICGFLLKTFLCQNMFLFPYLNSWLGNKAAHFV